MSVIAVDALLAVAVFCVWLGCLGLFRLPTPLDRIHCIAFVNAAAGGALLLAAMVADGPSVRVFKIAASLAVALLSGAATSHAFGRALIRRGER